MRFIFSLIISLFLIFPSYAYDKKIKLNKTYIKTDSNKETIKINLNEMLDLEKIKKSILKALMKKANVNGYSGVLQPKIKDGKVVPNKKVLRILEDKENNFIGILTLYKSNKFKFHLPNLICSLFTVRFLTFSLIFQYNLLFKGNLTNLNPKM